MKPFRLRDLVAPLDADSFIRDHWIPERPFVSARNPRLLKQIAAIPELRDGPSLLKAYTGDVTLFGPDKSRQNVSVAEARKFVRKGHTAYMPNVQDSVPTVRELWEHLIDDLGAPRGSFVAEAFYAVQGALSSAHYDHDVNFQILLAGKKRWRIAPNGLIDAPLAPYHPRPGGLGARQGGFVEEANAKSATIPFDIPAEGMEEFVVGAGSVVFLPRGYWHEVTMLEGCFALNIVIKGQTFASALANALAFRLLADPHARGYLIGNRSTSSVMNEHAGARLRDVRRHAQKALASISLDEIFLGLGKETEFYAWNPAAEDRTLQKSGHLVDLHVPGLLRKPLPFERSLRPVLERLVSFKNRFCYPQVLARLAPHLSRNLDARAIWDTIEILLAKDLLVRAPGPPRPTHM